MRVRGVFVPQALRLFENAFDSLHPEALTCLDNGAGCHERTLAG